MIRRRALLAAMLLAPSAARAHAFKSRAVRFAGAGKVPLAGTLLLPLRSEMQYVPGVVLVAGSGPTDRDGNNPLVPTRIDLLKQIAEHLASAGVASLRYDKRGIAASGPPPTGLEQQEAFFSWSNFVGDVRAAHAELLTHDEIKPYATALLGHSEGGLLVLAAASAMTAPPHAVVLASTPGRTLYEVIRDQIGRSAPAFLPETERTMAAIAATGRVPTQLAPELRRVFPAAAGSFFKEALAFDPAAALASLDRACLLVHGGADRQVVPLGDIQPLLDVLARRRAPGEAFIAPAVSHNLKLVSGPNDNGFAGPLAPAIADKLVSWLGTALGA